MTAAPASPATAPASPAGEAARYDYLDGLRGLAVAGVVATHVGQAVPGLPAPVESFMVWGLRGVHLFFIVSALTLMLVTRPERFAARPFFTRRFFRIAPMFYLAAIFYTAMNWTGAMPTAVVPPTGMDVALTLLFLHGFNPHGINNVVPGGWSIACEATFYALLPLLLPFTGRVRGAVAIAGGALLLAVGAVVARQMLKAELTGPAWGDFLHFNFAMNALPFGLGILIHALLRRHGGDPRVIALCGPLRLVAVAALLAVATIADRLPAGELPYALILATFVFAVAVRPGGVLSGRVMTYLGHVSFSLYLVHFAVLFVLERIVPRTGTPMADLVILYVAALGVSAAVASAFYHGLEKPMIALGRTLTRGNRRATAPVPGVARW